MMVTDPTSIDFLSRGWLLLLAFSVVVLLVAALRWPCRRLFGTERAFQLWLLPPLAMLASQLPHPAARLMDALPPVVYVIVYAAAALPAHAAAATSFDWRAAVMLFWLAGAIVALLLATAVQWRYRRRLIGATPVLDVATRWPVLRARGVNVGPALVGAWRARIVVPADFVTRYDDAERVLILAHEAIHARRGDGWWCLCAQFVGVVFWFHPLAWWALAALRHDQELACDAAVLRDHGGQRCSYANAMLKTQSAAFPLPVGCPWSPRHPITERIAMLKLPQPSQLRRRIGGILLACVAISVAVTVHASTSVPQSIAVVSMSDHFSLKIDVAIGGRPDSMHFTRCVAPGEYSDVSGTEVSSMSWQGSFAVLPEAGGQLEIRARVDTRFDRGGGKVQTQSAKPVVRTMPGQQAIIVFGEAIDSQHSGSDKPEDDSLKIRLTPSIGCDNHALASPGVR